MSMKFSPYSESVCKKNLYSCITERGKLHEKKDMTDDPFNRPIRPIGEEDQDRLKISRIEPLRELNPEDEEEEKIQFKQKVGPFAAFFSFFKKLIDMMHQSRTEAATIMKDDVLVQDLEKLKLLFAQISLRDTSENTTFVQNLSETWISLSLHCEAIENGKMKSGIDPKKIRVLVASIGKYPEGAEHNLGYYLRHHAGKDWLPFPFMELLRKLHRNFAVDGEKSELHQWSQALNQIIPGKDIN